MKKVLITGNSGYIGSHLTKLLSKNYHVYGLDENKNTVPVVEHFLEDVCNIKPINIEFDTVIHLAALVNVNESERNPIDYYHVNLNGTLKVLHHTKFKNFIFASTGAAENCHSPYGVSKRAAEDCVRQFFKEIDITYTIFRFYNVIGADGFAPTNPDGLMHNLIKAKNTGKFTIFGNDYKKFASSVAKEETLKGLESVGRGSASAKRLFGEADLSVLPAVGQAVASATQGNVLPAMGVIPKIWNQAKTPEATRDALAKLLLQRGPEAQQTLRDLPNFMQQYNAAQARNSALANALAQQPTRTER